MNTPHRERFLSLTGAMMLAVVAGACLELPLHSQVPALLPDEPLMHGLWLCFWGVLSFEVPVWIAVAWTAGPCPPWHRWFVALAVKFASQALVMMLFLWLLMRTTLLFGKLDWSWLANMLMILVSTTIIGALLGWCVRLPRRAVWALSLCSATLGLAGYGMHELFQFAWTPPQHEEAVLQTQFTVIVFIRLIWAVPIGLVLERQLRLTRTEVQ
jgi:hypothetical protein